MAISTLVSHLTARGSPLPPSWSTSAEQNGLEKREFPTPSPSPTPVLHGNIDLASHSTAHGSPSPPSQSASPTSTSRSINLLPRLCLRTLPNALRAYAQAPHTRPQQQPPPPLHTNPEVLSWPPPSISGPAPRHAPPVFGSRFPSVTDRKFQTIKDLERPWAALTPQDPASSSPPQQTWTGHSAATTILLDGSHAKAARQPHNHLCIPESCALRNVDLVALPHEQEQDAHAATAAPEAEAEEPTALDASSPSAQAQDSDNEARRLKHKLKREKKQQQQQQQ